MGCCTPLHISTTSLRMSCSTPAGAGQPLPAQCARPAQLDAHKLTPHTQPGSQALPTSQHQQQGGAWALPTQQPQQPAVPSTVLLVAVAVRPPPPHTATHMLCCHNMNAPLLLPLRDDSCMAC